MPDRAEEWRPFVGGARGRCRRGVSRSPARKGEARARAEGTSCTGDLVRRALVRSLLAAGAGARLHLLRREARSARLRRRGRSARSRKNLNVDEQWDLAQWYNVVNVEVEAKPFPNGLGPIEILEFYVRAEARYDCVWTRACGIFPSVNTYGDRAERLPNRLIDGDAAGFTGTLTQRRHAPGVERGPQQLPARLPRRSAAPRARAAALRPAARLREPVRQRLGPQRGVRAAARGTAATTRRPTTSTAS